MYVTNIWILLNSKAVAALGRVLCLVLAVLAAGCALSLKQDVDAGDTKAVLAKLDEVGIDAQLSPLGNRPLIEAAGHGHLQLVEALLNKGADVNATDVTGWTPLHAAAYHGDSQVVRLLLDRGATIGSSNWYTPTPLVVAEKMNHPDVVELLKKADQKNHAQPLATNPHSRKPNHPVQ
jgi:ankyrin repeat protein